MFEFFELHNLEPDHNVDNLAQRLEGAKENIKFLAALPAGARAVLWQAGLRETKKELYGLYRQALIKLPEI